MENLTREQLIEIGVNPDNLCYPDGEMNVIVQSFGYEDGMQEEYDHYTDTETKHPVNKLYPDIYHPRKNCGWSCGCEGDAIPFEDEEDKKDWVKHLRDSAERLKIMAYYLTCQANEIEEFGYPKTTCYYPE